MLEFLLRLVGTALTGGSLLLIPLTFNDFQRASVPFPGAAMSSSIGDYGTVQRDLVSIGLLVAVGLICFAAATLLAAVMGIRSKLHDPYDNHPKMAAVMSAPY